MTEIRILRAQISSKFHSTEKMIIANGEVQGIGFFPAANGIIQNDETISEKSIMVLGQDQDNEIGFLKTIEQQNETYSATWRNLFQLLEKANVDKKQCFFTNALIGIRKNCASNTGKSPFISNSKYLMECLNFLEMQIRIQRPKFILCLGIIPAKLLSLLSKSLSLKFMFIESFKEIDEQNLNVIENLAFDEIENYNCNIVVLCHPSYRTLNSKHRSYKNLIGEDAELKMINDGLKMSGA